MSSWEHFGFVGVLTFLLTMNDQGNSDFHSCLAAKTSLIWIGVWELFFAELLSSPFMWNLFFSPSIVQKQAKVWTRVSSLICSYSCKRVSPRSNLPSLTASWDQLQRLTIKAYRRRLDGCLQRQWVSPQPQIIKSSFREVLSQKNTEESTDHAVVSPLLTFILYLVTNTVSLSRFYVL